MTSAENPARRDAPEAAAALARARALLAAPGPLDEKTRADALAALEELGKALEPALASHPAEARTVTHFAEAAAHEATQPRPSGSLLEIALDGLAAAAERLAERHPTIAAYAERIADALAQIGI